MQRSIFQLQTRTGRIPGGLPVTFQTGTKFEAFFATMRSSAFFREKTGFYDKNPIAQRFGMGFAPVTVHALREGVYSNDYR